MINPSVYNLESFIEAARLIHGNKYDYSKVVYNNHTSKVIIVCSIHGEFKQAINTHLQNHGCKKCGIIQRAEKRKYSLDNIISRCKNKYSDRYDYSLIKEYNGINSKVNIICNTCEIIFKHSLNLHLNSNKEGCPNCKLNRGWKRKEWIDYCKKSKKSDPKVYIVRCYNDTEEFIKIGMTSKTVSQRFKKIPYSYEIIKEIKGSSDFVYDKEKELHRLYSKHKYLPKIKFKGMFECFSIKILN